MKDAYTVIYKETDGWWIGWIKEIPGVCQEKTKEGLFQTLRVTLEEALDLSEEEATESVFDGFHQNTITL